MIVYTLGTIFFHLIGQLIGYRNYLRKKSSLNQYYFSTVQLLLLG